MPSEPIQLDAITTITSPIRFVETHIMISQQYSGKRIFLPYLQRLKNLKALIENKQQHG